MIVTVERVRELLKYDPDAGHFFWLKRRGGATLAGTIAGSTNKKGYVVISIDDRLYKAHRLAHLIVTGEWPKEQIDHINLDKSDNRWVNPREATNAQNRRNTPRVNKNPSGYKGVHKHGNRWRACIRVDGHLHYLGQYSTPTEAHKAYCDAAREYFGEFARAA